MAAVRARHGKVKEVVAALQAALIEGRPDSAGKKEFFFTAFLMIDGKIVVKSAEQIDIYLN